MKNPEASNILLTAQYTVKETCNILGVCRTTLQKYTSRGYISVKYRACNHRPYYTGKAILRFLKSTAI